MTEYKNIGEGNFIGEVCGEETIHFFVHRGNKTPVEKS
jgi:hypothetical protein